jgi:hypothetical protein
MKRASEKQQEIPAEKLSLLKWVISFFPTQLFLLQVKRNFFMNFLWILLFCLVCGWIGKSYGVQYLFLAPEFMGQHSPLAFFMLGFSFGGFILAFNLYTYVMYGHLFPFIVTLNRPFSIFSLNNMFIPLLFLIVYSLLSIRFQLREELFHPIQTIFNVLALYGGILFFRLISSLYFLSTSKSAVGMLRGASRKGSVGAMLGRIANWNRNRYGQDQRRVKYYLGGFFRIRNARGIEHYDRNLLLSIFSRHHLNASIFEILALLTFLVIGSFGENPFFAIPAAASTVLYLTMLVMAYSALYSWFKGWTPALVIMLLVILNFAFANWGPLRVESRAYGLGYQGSPVRYNPENTDTTTAQLREHDFREHLELLDNRRKRLQLLNDNDGKKPVLIVLNVSGGGTRSALWTMEVLHYADSISRYELFPKLHLISGSSGGMIGAAYYRELYLKGLLADTPDKYVASLAERDKISLDLLNPILFRAVTNDLFIRYQKFKIGEELYTKDRGYAFEKQLNANTGGCFNKTLEDYRVPEKNARIPLLVMNPTVANDGRRLILSSQPMSFLEPDPLSRRAGSITSEGTDYHRLFRNHFPEKTRLSSALRMNATFPFVMPAVNLPTEPPIEVLDAGLRDNFGVKTTIDYLRTFRNWIETNTSGVLIIRVRDTPASRPVKDLNPSLWGRFSAPLGTVYGNFTRMQEYSNDKLLGQFLSDANFPVRLIDFELSFSEEERISLSWHLTRREKEAIRHGMLQPTNTLAAEELRAIISGETGF